MDNTSMTKQSSRFAIAFFVLDLMDFCRRLCETNVIAINKTIYKFNNNIELEF